MISSSISCAVFLILAVLVMGGSASDFSYSIWRNMSPYACNNPGGPVQNLTVPSLTCVGFTAYNQYNVNLSIVKVFKCDNGKLSALHCDYPVVMDASGNCKAATANLSSCTTSIANPYLCSILQTGNTTVPSITVKVTLCSNDTTTSTGKVGTMSSSAQWNPGWYLTISVMSVLCMFF